MTAVPVLRSPFSVPSCQYVDPPLPLFSGSLFSIFYGNFPAKILEAKGLNPKISKSSYFQQLAFNSLRFCCGYRTLFRRKSQVAKIRSQFPVLSSQWKQNPSLKEPRSSPKGNCGALEEAQEFYSWDVRKAHVFLFVQSGARVEKERRGNRKPKIG